MALRLLTLLILSGFASLSFEVASIRRMAGIVGHSADATGVVVGVFLLGLGLGSALFACLPVRSRCYRVLVALEVGVALWAWAAPWIFQSLDGFYVEGARQGLAPLPLALLVASIGILPPTLLMGANFPLVLGISPQRRMGWLYGWNTLGATAGALMAGWVLLPTLGISGTFWVGAGCNLAAACLAATLIQQGEPPVSGGSSGSGGVRLFWVAFCTGFSSLAVQMTWTRALALLLGASVYGYSAALAISLAGMTLGCCLLGRIGPASPGQLGSLLATAVLAVMLSHGALPQIPQVAAALHLEQWQAATFAGALLPGIGMATLILLPASVVMGMILPCLVELDPPAAGRLLATNTLGALLACLTTSHLTIPWLGIDGSLRLSALGLLAAWLCLGGRPRLLVFLGILAVWSAPAWNLASTSVGALIYAKLYAGRQPQALVQPAFYADGRCASVSVTISESNVALRINGKVDASLVREDRQTMLLTGYLPSALHPRPRSALVVGLGSGLTLRALANIPTLESIRCLELEQKVVEANRYWAGYNGHVLEDPRVSVEVADGRTALRTSRQRFDLICSEPSNLWVGGVSGLFTQEFYQACLQRLESGGVMCQWLQLYGLSPAELQTVLRTFFGVFPHGGVWQSATGDLLLIGTLEPRPLDLRRVRALWESSQAVRDDWASIDLYRPEYLIGHFLQDRSQATYPDLLPHTDDRPSLEFSTPISYFLPESVATNLRLLRLKRLSEACLPEGIPPSPKAWIDAAHGWLALGRVQTVGPMLLPFKRTQGCKLPVAVAAHKSDQPVAEQLFQEALREDPTDALAVWLAGLFYLETNRPQQALALLNRLDYTPASGRAPKGLSLPGLDRRLGLIRGNLKHRQGDLDGACLDLQSAIQRLPAAADLHDSLARVYELRGQTRLALRHYQKALRLNDCQLSSWLGVGRCQLKSGSQSLAQYSFGRALSLSPGHPDALKNRLRSAPLLPKKEPQN